MQADTPHNSADALVLTDINTRYGESHVLHDVSLTLKQGRVLALLGRNGAGKTTTMHSIVGYQPAMSGRITLFGQEIASLAPEAISDLGIALVPQGRRIFTSLTVQENLDVAHRRGSKPRFGFDTLFDWFPRLKERRDQLGLGRFRSEVQRRGREHVPVVHVAARGSQERRSRRTRRAHGEPTHSAQRAV